MGITVREVKTAKDKKDFIKLPYELHKNHQLWVPPLFIHEKKYINPKKNVHMAYSKTICFLAYKDGRPVGRIMGIINNKVIETWNDLQARFCNFESINNQEVAHKLLSAVEKWARKNRMKRLVGPLGFSNQDPQGFIIDGFEQRPSVGTIYNFDYIPGLIEKEGYTKEVDYVTYKIPFSDKIPEIYEKISERVKKRSVVELLEFTKKKEVKQYLPDLFRFMNETYSDIYGFIPLSEELIRKTARTYSEIINPNFIKIIIDETGEIVSFILGIQDITEGFKKAHGRLFPFGYFIIKTMQKKSKRLDLLLGAIKKEHRGKGLNTLMAISMIKSAHKLKMEFADSHHELESNNLVQAEMRHFGGRVYKRHRVYQKEL